MAGRIQLIIGPMFSGKTTELMRLLKRYRIAKYRCLVLKYHKDDRYDSNCIASHDKHYIEAMQVSKLSQIMDLANNYDVIGIDEGQFFPDIVTFANEMAEKGKIVLVAALDSTFEKKAFGDILQLIPLAENVVKLTAVCMNCTKEASFTKRIGTEKEVEIIGGADKYLSVCRKCYPLDFQNNKENELVSPKPTPTKSRPTLGNSPTLVNSPPLTAVENEIGVEDFQPPPLVNIKMKQVRGKLFSSP